MGYTAPATVYTGDTWTASNHNTYFKDNIIYLEAQAEGEYTAFLWASGLIREDGNEPGLLERLTRETITHVGLPFDKDSDEYVDFGLGMPKRYDGGSYYMKVGWTTEPISIRNSSYKWTASGSGTNEYYLEAAGGGDPGLGGQPGAVYENGTSINEGTAGSLSASEWDYADNDSLGYSTIYIRLSDGSDPDSASTDHVEYSPGGVVVWSAEANIIEDGDSLGQDPASGGGSVSDTWLGKFQLHQTDWFEVTPAGSVSGDNPILENRFFRDANNGSDTIDDDVYLLCLWVRWTADQETDD